MKALSNKMRIAFDIEGNLEITFTLKSRPRAEIDELMGVLGNGKDLVVEVKQHRQKRSLDANSYFWVLCTKVADVLRASKEEIYIKMLERYGQREEKLLSVVVEAVDMIYRATNNHCTEVGESELNGKLFKHMAILRGSSTYNGKEMSILIDGIVSEAKDLGIETMTPNELALLKEKWK